MNDTAEYQSVLRSASDVAALKLQHRDAVRRNDDAAHGLHEVKTRLRRWANTQALTPFLSAGTAIIAAITGLVLSSVLPAGAFDAGGFMLLALGCPIAAGAALFWVASGIVRELRRQATRARSAVNLSERDLLDAADELAAAEGDFWARKRPTV